jgi:hypothetical protein
MFDTADEAPSAEVFEPFFTTKAVGVGTYIRIHFSQNEPVTSAAVVDELIGPTIALDTRRSRMPVVENEHLTRVFLGHLLLALEHDVLVAETGRRAFEIARVCGAGIDSMSSEIVLRGSRHDERGKSLES